ncbi:nucleoside diphosphate-linked moiety X motif 8 [Venturia canescens]|uniref:nucleoside diphosphate-linked moiety X motif 8 n=1 Tax=Venturia canescens TaxID=32260 RepID=UPI001C9BE459|nr:nucleoside diphosphate-linked moiety X motif 8 [Venturia canescens]
MALSRTTFERFLRLYLNAEGRRSHSILISKTLLSPETVLATKNRESCVRKLKLYPTMKVHKETRMAAVLVPLCSYKGELGLLYTLRSRKLSSNKGQVSFPGGMKDDNDKSLEVTALRETWEELRIPESQVDVWSQTNIISRKDLSVLPIFGYIGQVDPENLAINHDEVEEAFVISLENLCNPEHFRFTQFRNGMTLPVYLGGKHRVWGLTAAITHMIMKALVPEVYKNKLEILPKLESTKCSNTAQNQKSIYDFIR